MRFSNAATTYSAFLPGSLCIWIASFLSMRNCKAFWCKPVCQQIVKQNPETIYQNFFFSEIHFHFKQNFNFSAPSSSGGIFLFYLSAFIFSTKHKSTSEKFWPSARVILEFTVVSYHKFFLQIPIFVQIFSFKCAEIWN